MLACEMSRGHVFSQPLREWSERVNPSPPSVHSYLSSNSLRNAPLQSHKGSPDPTERLKGPLEMTDDLRSIFGIEKRDQELSHTIHLNPYLYEVL